MYNSDKCIIDNWSLEHAAYLLTGDNKETFPSDKLFVNGLGGLSNFINALLLYEDTKFIANGYQTHWYRLDWFKKNATLYIKPYIPDDVYLDWSNHIATNNFGANHYLLTSKYLDADLFISPERAQLIIENGKPRIDKTFFDVLQKIDEKIRFEKTNLWSDNVKVGIEENFVLPSLTHYVLSQASNRDDLFTVIMQIKSSNVIKDIMESIKALANSTKDFSKFQMQIENIIKTSFGKPSDNDKPWSINLSVLFLTITKSFNSNFLQRKNYITFLKDVITCRSEAFSLKKEIEKVFNRKIDFNLTT